MTIASDGRTQICLSAFLLWMSPVLTFAVLLVLGGSLLLLARTITHANASSTAYGIRVMGYAIAVAFVGMFSAASLQGAGMKLTNAAFAIFGVAVCGIIVLVGTTMGWGALKYKVKNQHFVRKLYSVGKFWQDVGHAFAIFFGWFPFVAMLILSFLNQLVRKLSQGCGLTCTKPLKSEERKLNLTSVGARMTKFVSEWDLTAAIMYTYAFGWGFWAFKWGANLTYIFLNWLIEVLTPLHWGAVTGIFVGIGLVMFLIPIVPGPAVYLTCGTLMVPLCEKAWTKEAMGPPPPQIVANAALDPCAAAAGPACDKTGWPFWLATVYACAMSYVLKLLGHVMQQKGIGEVFGRSIAIRAMVSPNSRVMKGVRYLLSQRGVSAGKVAIMCGGPDWPTSVIAGLLKLSCIQMLLGLTPMFIITVPTTMAGAFMTKKCEPYANLPALFILISVFAQLTLVIFFMKYVGQALHEHADVIDAYPDDEEVAKLEAEAQKLKEARLRAIRFARLPLWLRALIISGSVVAIGSSYVLILKTSLLFQPFDLTDCAALLGGTIDGVDYSYISRIGVSLYGLVAIGCLGYSILCWWIFQRWAKRAAHAELAASGVADEAPPAAVGGSPPQIQVHQDLPPKAAPKAEPPPSPPHRTAPGDPPPLGSSGSELNLIPPPKSQGMPSLLGSSQHQITGAL